MIAHIYPSVLQAVSGRGYVGYLDGCFQGYRAEAMQDLGYELPRIPIPRTRVNKNAKGYYEPLHSTLSSTFCPSGTNTSNSLAGLIMEMVAVSPSTSKKVTRAFSSSGTKTSILS